MEMDLKQAMEVIRTDLDREWGEIDFDYTIKQDSNGKPRVNISAHISLNQHDDDIEVIVEAFPSGMACLRAVFDEIPETAAVMRMLNHFNQASIFFRAYRRDDGYLELENDILCQDVSELRHYASDAMYFISNLSDNEDLQRLTKLTN